MNFIKPDMEIIEIEELDVLTASFDDNGNLNEGAEGGEDWGDVEA